MKFAQNSVFLIENLKLFHNSQECIAETQDWRKCQDVVKEFKSCMQVYTDRQRKLHGN